MNLCKIAADDEAETQLQLCATVWRGMLHKYSAADILYLI